MYAGKTKKNIFARIFPFSWKDFFITVGIFSATSALCFLLQRANSMDGFAAPIFVLAVLLVSRLTTGYLFGFIASVLGVVFVNFVFTYPYWHVNFTLSGYPLSFLAFLGASMMTCALTTQVRQQERLRAENEKEKMRANLLRAVSHDIRTPLTSIIGSTSAVLDNPDLPPEEQRELLQDACDEAQWLIRVVENLLSITRISNGDSHLSKQPEAAEEILGDTIRKFRHRFPQAEISVTVPDSLLIVPMDPILIQQVLDNLLENAVTHGRASHIRLTVQESGGFARFSVEDNGSGIKKNLLPDLFSGTLKQSEEPNNDGKRNMGLGLSVCLAIVRAHGGSMDAQNLPDGASFSFYLPLDTQGGLL